MVSKDSPNYFLSKVEKFGYYWDFEQRMCGRKRNLMRVKKLSNGKFWAKSKIIIEGTDYDTSYHYLKRLCKKLGVL